MMYAMYHGTRPFIASYTTQYNSGSVIRELICVQKVKHLLVAAFSNVFGRQTWVRECAAVWRLRRDEIESRNIM